MLPNSLANGLLAALCLISVAAVQAQTTDDDSRQRLIIHDLAETYGQAFAIGEPDTVVAHLTEDFVAFTQGKAPVRGREAVREQVAADLQQMDVYELIFNIEEIELLGDTAWASGNSQARIILPEDGTRLEVKGAFLWVLKKQADGRWLIHRDAASASGPPQVLPPEAPAAPEVESEEAAE